MKLTKNKIPLFVVFGLSFIIGLILLIIPFTSQMPDGLAKVSKDTVGFIKKEIDRLELYEILNPDVQKKFNECWAELVKY